MTLLLALKWICATTAVELVIFAFFWNKFSDIFRKLNDSLHPDNNRLSGPRPTVASDKENED